MLNYYLSKVEEVLHDNLEDFDKKNTFFGLSSDFVQKYILKKPRLVSFVIASKFTNNSDIAIDLGFQTIHFLSANQLQEEFQKWGLM